MVTGQDLLSPHEIDTAIKSLKIQEPAELLQGSNNRVVKAICVLIQQIWTEEIPTEWRVVNIKCDRLTCDNCYSAMEVGLPEYQLDKISQLVNITLFSGRILEAVRRYDENESGTTERRALERKPKLRKKIMRASYSELR